MKKDLTNKTLYEFNASQDVVKLQTKYSLFKRVINILTYAKSDKEIDWIIMTKAINLMIERNDCMRLRFVKDKKKDKQYFITNYTVKNIPYKEFINEKDQNNFILKFRKKPVNYMNGEIFNIVFIKTSDK